jgi:hypothetical protein
LVGYVFVLCVRSVPMGFNVFFKFDPASNYQIFPLVNLLLGKREKPIVSVDTLFFEALLKRFNFHIRKGCYELFINRGVLRIPLGIIGGQQLINFFICLSHT